MIQIEIGKVKQARKTLKTWESYFYTILTERFGKKWGKLDSPHYAIFSHQYC